MDPQSHVAIEERSSAQIRSADPNRRATATATARPAGTNGGAMEPAADAGLGAGVSAV